MDILNGIGKEREEKMRIEIILKAIPRNKLTTSRKIDNRHINIHIL